MDLLFEQFAFKLRSIDFKHRRFLYDVIDWSRNPVVIKGARSVGKSSLALQYVKQKYKNYNQVLYVSADHIYFSQNSLEGFAEKFAEKGGKHLFIDEIHKYDGWHREIERVLKKFDKLHIVLIGSAVEDYGKSDYINENAAVYELPGLSLREFILFSTGLYFEPLDLDSIIESHTKISSNITAVIDPTAFIDAYLRYGYYPYFMKDRSNYPDFVIQNLNLFLESDLTNSKGVDFKNLNKIKQLLLYLANHRQAKLNISDISTHVNATRSTVLQYFYYLSQGRMLNLYKKANQDSGIMTKPDSIFLNNTNLLSVFSEIQNSDCFLQKTFFQNQLSYKYLVNYSKDSDFMVSGMLFDIVHNKGINKTILDNDKKKYVVDAIEIGVSNQIPLWLFGFMY